MLLLAPVLVLVAYAAAAHRLLSGPQLRAWINADPESLTIDYDAATSLWPGRVTIKNLRIRSSDSNVQFLIRLGDARVRYSVLGLFARTFRCVRLRGSGLSFWLRNKIEPRELQAADVSLQPAIPGFADPPLRKAENPIAAAPAGNPWKVEIRNLSIDRFDDIWIDAWRYQGVARVEGGFFLRPGLLAQVGPARVIFDSGDLRIAKEPAAISLSGTVSATFEPYEPFRVHGSQVWKKTSGKVQLDGQFGRLAFLQHLVASSAGTRLEGGAGRATIQGAIEDGIAIGDVRVVIQEGSVRLSKLVLQGDADLRLLIPRWDLANGPLEISGSRIALSDVRSYGSDASRRWWGRFDIPSGKIDSHTVVQIKAQSRDARPLLAVLGAGLPGWTQDLLKLQDFSATATVSMGPSMTRVGRLDANGGGFHIQGDYAREKANREGAFLIESGVLSVGVEMESAGTKVRLLGAKQWFEDRRIGANALRTSMKTPDPRSRSSGGRATAVGLSLD